MSTPIIPFTAEKQNYLEQLATYDEATLARLVQLASFIVLPDEDQLVNVTMEQMVNKAHALADTYFPEWTDRSKSDFGEFLLEVMCLFSEKDFFYINAFTNEGFLLKATLYSSVYAHAKKYSYDPKTVLSATGWVSVLFAAGPTCKYYSGDLSFNIGDYTYSNSETFVVPESASPVYCQIKVAEGIYDTLSSRFNGRFVAVNNESIDITSVEQTIGGIKWTRVDSFANSSSDDKHFCVIPNEKGRVEVVYGKNNFGLLPDYDAVVNTKFRTCSGSLGNQANTGQLVTVTSNKKSRDIDSQVLVGSLSGGIDAEDIETIRLRVPHQFRTQGRIINTADCEAMLRLKTWIYQAVAFVWNGSFVFYVIPKSGIAATSEQLAELSSEFAQYTMEGFSIRGDLTVYKTISALSLTVIAHRGYDEVTMRNLILDIIENWTNPITKAEYGKGFLFSDVSAEILRSVPGTRNVPTWSVTSDGTDSADGVTIAPAQILRKFDRSSVALTIAY